MEKEFYNYIVYDDGRVFSNYTHKFLKGDIVKGYIQYTLYINKKPIHYKAHKLVAMLFIPNPNNYNCINHIDGDKLNNTINNLEWRTIAENNKYARDAGLNNISQSNIRRWSDENYKRTVGQKIAQTQLNRGTNKGENNPNFRYRIYWEEELISRVELARRLNISQSWCDILIRRANSGTVDKFINNNIKIIDLKKG